MQPEPQTETPKRTRKPRAPRSPRASRTQVDLSFATCPIAGLAWNAESRYDAVLDALRALPAGEALKFPDGRVRQGLSERAKKQGLALEFAQAPGGELCVRLKAGGANAEG